MESECTERKAEWDDERVGMWRNNRIKKEKRKMILTFLAQPVVVGGEMGRESDTAKVQSLARKPISNLQAKRRHARLVQRSGMTSESRVPYLFASVSHSYFLFLFFRGSPVHH